MEWSRARTRVLGAWLAAIVAAGPGGGCGNEEDDLRVGGVRVHRVTLLESRTRYEGLEVRYEDWVLRNGRARILVGGLSRPLDQRGAVLEIRMEGLADDEGEVSLAPSVHVGARRYPVTVQAIRAIERDGKAILRIVGIVRNDAGMRLRYSREVTLDRYHGALAIASRVAAESGRGEVRIGERVNWGGHEPFVQGAGFVTDERFREAGFVAAEGVRTGLVLARVDRPAHVGVVFEQHGTERLAQFAEFVDPARPLAEDESLTERAVFAVGAPGMNDALRIVGAIAGSPYPEAIATIEAPPPQSIVRVRTPDGRLLLVARPNANGTVRIPLAPFASETRFVAAATARGHAGGASVTFVAGDRFRLDIPSGGRVRIAARDRDGGLAIPARARFIPVQGSPAIDLGPDSSGAGAKDSVLLVNGLAVVPIPKGTYRVLVTHGPEWTLHDETVVVTETFQPDVRATLTHLIDPGPFVGCDLHLHASPSPDSRVSLEDRIRSLVAEGVEFAVPTDHNHVTDYGPTAASLGSDARGFLTIPGVEATTWDPAYGHFNAYPAPLVPDAPGQGAPNALQTRPGDLFAALHDLGPEVVVQVNHPRSEGGIGYFDVERYDATTGRGSERFSEDFDALEVWNGFDLARADTFAAVFADYLAMITRGVHVTAVGNSDSHLIRYQWAGYPRTYARASTREPHAILEAIRLGRTFVSSGPFLEAQIGEAGPGDTASAIDGKVQLRIRVRTAPYVVIDHLTVYLNATKVVDRAIPAPRRRRSSRAAPTPDLFESSHTIPVARDAAILVVVSGTRMLDDYFGRASIPPLAFTSPIWIDGDGDGIGPRDPRVRPERHYDAGVGEPPRPPTSGGSSGDPPEAGTVDASTEGEDAAVDSPRDE